MAKAGEIQGPQRREKPLLLLMDGHALVYRAWHALQQPMTLRKTGEEVRAVYGFTSTFLKALQDWSPTHVAIAFDRPTPTFRHVQYEAYKAQRPEAPPELRQQFVRVRQLLEAFHIPIYERDGYEADDVLGALCRQASEQGMETLILTGDTDTLQLVSPLVKVLLYHRIQERMVFDEAQIAARYGGLTPHQHPHLKALQGDASDNIPGVPGVGEKTAVKLLQEFGSLQGIYENLDRVPQRLRETLASHREQVALGLELVTIVRDVPGIALDPDKTCFWRYDRREVVELLRELEFVSLVGRIPEGQAATGTGSTPTAPSDPSAPRELQYHTVARPEDLESLLSELANSPAFAFDLETTGKDPLRGELVGLAFATRPGRAFYVPVGHLSGAQLDRGEVLHRLQPLLEDPGLPKTAHNANFDMTVLGNLGIQVRGLACDTMLAAALLGYKNPGLKAMALERLGQEMTPISKLIGEGRKQGTMDRVAVADASAYACGDADMTLRLRAVLEPDLAREGMGNLFTQVEVPLVPVLVQMQTNGIALDVPTLRKMSRSLGEQLQRSEIQAYEAVGHLFNLNSPKQLSELLFGELRLEKTKRMKTGSYSTDAASLEALRGGHDVVPIILEYRQLSKLKSTYVDALPELVNPRTGRLHTSYNQAGAVTGRISSSEPNLQNIPIRTELGRRIRNAFVPGQPGWLLLAADYSQIELRVLAHLSQDPALLEAFHRDLDIHAATASQVYGVPLEGVTPDMRRIAKVLNFGVIYGLSPYGISQQTELTPEAGARFIESYLGKYPRVREYIERTKQQARDQGYVETLLGRRRRIPEALASNSVTRQAAEREAINMPVQGTAAEIMKLAMIHVHQRMAEAGLHSRMLLQVHDELIFEAPEEESEALKGLVLEVMPRAMALAVPLKVVVKVGPTWGDLE